MRSSDKTVSQKETVEQFYRDVGRLDIKFASNDTSNTRELPLEELERRLTLWWFSHIGSNEVVPPILAELPESLEACIYWCTQTALAEHYVKFIHQHGIYLSDSRHLLDSGPQTILFREDGRIAIDKPFRESIVSPSGCERTVKRWLLKVVVDPNSAEPRVPESAYWHCSEDVSDEPTHACRKRPRQLLMAATTVAAAIVVLRTMQDKAY